MKPIIEVKRLSKKYKIRHEQKYLALRDEISNFFKSLIKQDKGLFQTKEDFWALKDISFNVNKGDVVGIIGKNGAGKTTLLKVISRIVHPTKGEICLRGRVASLLEVGTGFHPELTGRENIYFNGSILGMRKREIDKKFDEIVAFSEVEKFLDTPIKRYSSGMRLRLAFAVAAHLEPEILLIDEVLAVGDAMFQKKCLGKIGEATKEGRTILFVSHNMAAITNLCKRVILLDCGSKAMEGDMEPVIKRYLQGLEEKSQIMLSERKDRKGNANILFVSVFFQDEKGKNVSTFYCGQNIKVILHYKNLLNKELHNLRVDIAIDNQAGNRITWMSSDVINSIDTIVPSNYQKVELSIYNLCLAPGRYAITLYSSINGEIADWIQSACYFDVEASDFYKTGKLIPAGQGDFLMNYNFAAKI